MPLVGVALISFIVGMVKGCPGSPNRDAAEQYVEYWAEGNYVAMYDMLSTKSREGITQERFIARYGSFGRGDYREHRTK